MKTFNYIWAIGSVCLILLGDMLKFILALTIMLPPCPGFEAGDETSQHMTQFAQFAENHHDNIDDTSEVHLHVHKHSEDGEEHEHDHEHKMGFHSEVKTIYSTVIVNLMSPDFEQGVGFVENSLVSDPHPHGIFRPPRS